MQSDQEIFKEDDKILKPPMPQVAHASFAKGLVPAEEEAKTSKLWKNLYFSSYKFYLYDVVYNLNIIV